MLHPLKGFLPERRYRLNSEIILPVWYSSPWKFPPKPRKLPEKDDLPKCRIALACKNIRSSSLFVAGDVSSSAAKSEEKLMFSQARITFIMTTLDTVVPFYGNDGWKYMSRLWVYDSLVVLVVLVERLCIGNKGHMQGYSRYTTDSPSSKYKHRRPLTLLHNIRNIRICMKKKTYCFLNLRKWKVLLTYIPWAGFSGFFRFLFSGRLMQWQIEWFYVPLVSAVSCAVFTCIESYKG